MTRYEYTQMNASAFLATVGARLSKTIRGEGFVALDDANAAVRHLEEGGWRLVSVGPDCAVFERALPDLPEFGPAAARRHLGAALHALSREERLPCPFSVMDDMRATIADLQDALAQVETTGGPR